MGKKTVDTEHLTRILFKWAADFSVDTDIVARTATSCYKTAASLALKLPDVDPESLRQRTDAPEVQRHRSDAYLPELFRGSETWRLRQPRRFQILPFLRLQSCQDCGVRK